MANRGRQETERAEGSVLGVILMIALCIALAATVYVWLSGSSSQEGTPQRTFGVTSNSTLAAGSPTGNKTYTIAGSTPGLRWNEVRITINGVPQTQYLGAGACADPPASAGPRVFLACSGTAIVTSASDLIQAGGFLRVEANAGDTLRVVDTSANAVVLVVTIV